MAVFKVLRMDPGTEKWLGFAKAKAQQLMTLYAGISSRATGQFRDAGVAVPGPFNEAFARTYMPEAGVSITVRGLSIAGEWVVKLILAGGNSGTIFMPIDAPEPTRRLFVLRDAARPPWPYFDAYPVVITSTYKEWEFRSRDAVGNVVVWGSDSGTLTPTNGGHQNILNNWWERYWLYSGLAGDDPDNPPHLTSIALTDSPAYINAYAAYTAYWTAHDAAFGERYTRVLLTDGTQLAAAPTSGGPSPPYENIDLEGWSGGTYLQLWDRDSGDEPLPGHKGTRLEFETPEDVEPPTAEFGMNSIYPVPSRGIITSTTPVTGGTEGTWAAKVGFHTHINNPWYAKKIGGVMTYLNYPVDLANGYFTLMLSGTAEVPTYQSVDDFAVANALDNGGPDPVADERAEWAAARAQAPTVLGRVHRQWASDQYLASLASWLLPSPVVRAVRLSVSPSDYYKASGSPTLDVTRSTSIAADLQSATHTVSLTFRYEITNEDGTTTVVVAQHTGTREDTITEHALRDGPDPIGIVRVLRQRFTDWCNVQPSGSAGGYAGGAQAPEPGWTTAAGTPLDFAEQITFWSDAQVGGDEDAPLFAVVNGTRYLCQYADSAIALPLAPTGNSQGAFDLPLPYPSKVDTSIANVLPDLFRDVPALNVTTWAPYRAYRSACRPLVLGKKNVAEVVEGEDIIDRSFLDTRPDTDADVYVYVSTTTHPDRGDVGMFPVADDQADEGCTMTLRHVYKYRYLYATGDFVYVTDVLPAPYQLPAYPFGVSGLVVSLFDSSPPKDVGDRFHEAQTLQRSSFHSGPPGVGPIPYSDPTVRERDADGNPTAWYTHLGEFLNKEVLPSDPGYPDPASYREWQVQAWYYRQLAQFK